jgi:hypothetical protein
MRDEFEVGEMTHGCQRISPFWKFNCHFLVVKSWLFQPKGDAFEQTNANPMMTLRHSIE